MLNTNRLLSYIKGELGFPHVQIELSDEEILEHITEFTLREFSFYSPEKKKVNLNLDLDANKVPGRSNEFYITETEGLEILNVVEVYPTQSEYLIHGMRPLGPLSHFELREWALSNEMAMQLKMFSSFDTTFEFTHPNIVRISPVPNHMGNVIIEYERMQNPDLSGVNNEYQWVFMELSLADIMIKLGRIRKKYQDIKTPFGEIPLNQEVGDEGKEKKREILEKLNLGPIMNVIVDHG